MQHKDMSDVEELVLLSERRGLYTWLPMRVSTWFLRWKHRERIRELELMEYGEAREIKPIDWKRIFVGLLWILLLPTIILLAYAIYKVPQLLVAEYSLKLTESEWLQRINEARATLVQAIGGFILLIGLFFTWRNIRATEKNLKLSQDTTARNLEIAQEGLVTQRFSKAIELLGNDKLDVRLGGIYALERIAMESKKDHWPIMEILTAFVRANGSWKKGDPPEQIHTDIQAVLTVLGRRKKAHEYIGMRRSLSESRRIDLHGTNLQQVDLFGADLAGANLSEANLSKARMLGTNLKYANLDGTDLSDSEIKSSKLENTSLSGTQFNRALIASTDFTSAKSAESDDRDPANFETAAFHVCSLRNSIFIRANFRDAKFYGVSLNGAQLKGADFTGAKFDLINLKEVDLRDVEGLVPDQINKDGVVYEKANLPIHVQELLSVREDTKPEFKDAKEQNKN